MLLLLLFMMLIMIWTELLLHFWTAHLRFGKIAQSKFLTCLIPYFSLLRVIGKCRARNGNLNSQFNKEVLVMEKLGLLATALVQGGVGIVIDLVAAVVDHHD